MNYVFRRRKCQILHLVVTGLVLSASQIKVSVITKLICMIAGTMMCDHVKPVQDWGTNFDGKHAHDSTDLSVSLTTTDDVVTESRNDVQRSLTQSCCTVEQAYQWEQSLQRVSEYVAAVCSWSDGNNECTRTKKTVVVKIHSDVSQIAGVAFMNGQNNLPACDTSLGSKLLGSLQDFSHWQSILACQGKSRFL